MLSIKSEKKYFLIVIFIIILFGLALRFVGINGILSHDEWYTFDIVLRDFSDLNVQMYDDVHVPMYFYIIHLFSKLFDINDFSIRLISIFFNMTGVIIFYFFCRKYFNDKVTLIATILASLSAYNISAAQTARMYPLLFFLIVISLWLFVKIVDEKNNKKKDFIFLSIVNSVILYTHFFGFFWLLSQVIFFILERKNIYNKLKLIWAYFGTFLISLPVFLFAIIQVKRKLNGTSYANWMPETTIENIFETFKALSSNDLLSIPFFALIIYLFIKFIIKKKEFDLKTHSRIKLFFTFFIICFVIPLVITLITPVFAWRYFFIIYPVFILLIGISIDHLSRKYDTLYWFFTLIILFLITLSSIFFVEKGKLYEIKKNMCHKKIINKIDLYKQKDSYFITTRWLNEWVAIHKPINKAHEKLQKIINTDTLLINKYYTNLDYVFDDYEYLINITPGSGWDFIFVNFDSMKLIDNLYCEGMSFNVYKKM